MDTCYFCGGDSLTGVFQTRDPAGGEVFSIVRCTECGLVATRPLRSEAELGRYYASAYYGRRKLFFDVFINRARRRAVTRTLPQGSVLDVGCGSGGFLRVMQERWWRVQGTERAARSHTQDSLADIPVSYVALPDIMVPRASFEVVTFWHVLEHIADPKQYLLGAYDLLKPGGMLFLEVPNFDSWQARFGRERWFHLDAPRHTIHLTPAVAIRLLQSAGFGACEICYSSFLYDVFGWIQTLLNKITHKQNLLFDILGGRERWREHTGDTIITVLLLPFISLAAIILHFAGRIFRKTSVISIIAAKP